MIFLISVFGVRSIEANAEAKWLSFFFGLCNKVNRSVGGYLSLVSQRAILLLVKVGATIKRNEAIKHRFLSTFANFDTKLANEASQVTLFFLAYKYN